MTVNKQAAGRGRVRKKKSAKMSAQQRKRQERFFVIGAGLLFGALLAFVIIFSYVQSRPVGNEREVLTMGNLHVEMSQPSPISYNSTPPTSGPHFDTFDNFEADRVRAFINRYQGIDHH